jgi:hypothetical protein
MRPKWEMQNGIALYHSKACHSRAIQAQTDEASETLLFDAVVIAMLIAAGYLSWVVLA